MSEEEDVRRYIELIDATNKALGRKDHTDRTDHLEKYGEMEPKKREEVLERLSAYLNVMTRQK